MSTRIHFVVHSLLAAVFLLAQPLHAQGETTTSVEAFAAIEKEYDTASKEWMAVYRAATKSGASKEEIAEIATARPPGEALTARARKVLEARASEEDGAAAAIWLIRVAHVHGAPLQRSLDVLREHHVDSVRLNEVMLTLSRAPTPSVGMFLEQVVKTAQSTDTQARACHALAEHLKTKAGMVRTLTTANKEAMQRYESSYGRETLDLLKNEDPVAAEAQAAKRYQQVIGNEQYAAVDYFRGTLGAHCERALFEVQNLSIGKVAPDIVGEDIDGTAMKLSDYRGKVVVLDFWGDW